MRKRVHTFIQQCVLCKRVKSAEIRFIIPLVPIISSTPFRVLDIDLYTPGSVTSQDHRHVLTVVDLNTKWVAFLSVKTKFPEETVMTLCFS